jgi:hypothetical protein
MQQPQRHRHDIAFKPGQAGKRLGTEAVLGKELKVGFLGYIQHLVAGIVDVDSDPATAPIDVAFAGGVHFSVEFAPGFALLG